MAQLTLARDQTPPQALPLYPFQRDALDAVHAARARGVTRQLLAIPTGGGKTVVATHAVTELGLPTVFMVHREELATQTLNKFAENNPTLTRALCKADAGRYVEELRGHDVIVASAQTLAREQRLATLVRAVGGGGLLIVDEAHHSAADTWKRAIEALSPALLLGLTATPKRGDGLALDGLFDEIVYSVPMAKLVELQMLARPVGLRIGTSTSLDSVHTRAGELVESELAVVCNTPERNATVVGAYLEHCADRKATIVFCVDVAHARDLTDAFLAAGITAAYVVGSTPTAEREGYYEAMRQGELQVLVSVMVLTEGFDLPVVDAALMCRPTASQSLYIQMAGRALRKHSGKTHALIVDFVDVTAKHSLQTFMTLAGAEPRNPKVRQDDAADELVDIFGESGRASERKANVAKASHLLGDLLESSGLIWQALPGSGWFAPTGEAGYVAILQEGEGFVPHLLQQDRMTRAILHRPLFGRPVEAETAQLIAQQEVTENALTRKGAGWRQKPASDKALGYAVKLGYEHTGVPLAGEVSDYIDAAQVARLAKRAGLISTPARRN